MSAETKWEIFLQITAGEISQAKAARESGVFDRAADPITFETST